MGQDAYPHVYCQPIAYKPKVKPGQLSEEQIKRFYDEGYVLLEDFIDKSLLDNAKKSIENLVDEIAEDLLKAGKIGQSGTIITISDAVTFSIAVAITFSVALPFPSN